MRIVLTLGILLLPAVPVTAQEKGKEQPKLAGKVATEEEVRDHLKIAETKEGAARINAVKWFSTVQPPNEKIKKEVALKLIELLESPTTDGVTKGKCGDAFPNWATEEIAPKLMTYLSKDQRKGAIVALGRLKYEKAIPELIRSVESRKDPGLASQALIDMGSKAETAVLKMLDPDSKNKFAIIQGCIILREIGSKESVPALEKWAKHREKDYVNAAASALEAIKDREKAPEKK